MAAPFVYAPFTLDGNGVYQPQLQISWPPLQGIAVANYQVYLDGSGVPAGVTSSNTWMMTVADGLAASSTHSFQVDYVTTGGDIAPISLPASGTTWSSCNYMNSGVPCDWIADMYATNPWPSDASAPLTAGGPTLRQIFLSGGDPLNPATWLRTQLTKTEFGMSLSWNTQPGSTYQVQVSTDFTTWQNIGEPRFAAGTYDSTLVGAGPAGYYRVLLLRQ